MTITRAQLEAGLIDFSDIDEPDVPPIGPISPGETLRDWLDDLGLSAGALARAIMVPTNRITSILNGTRSITGETALRLARYLGTSPEFWMSLQSRYDLELAKARHEARVLAEVTPRAA